LTLGVDLAAADERTATAVVEWSDQGAKVRALQHGVSDGELVDAIRAADKAGVDCPLGWPAPFVDFVVAQQAGLLSPLPADVDGGSWRRGLAYRVTDQGVRAEAGVNPLSVSADRIAHAAFPVRRSARSAGGVGRAGGPRGQRCRGRGVPGRGIAPVGADASGIQEPRSLPSAHLSTQVRDAPPAGQGVARHGPGLGLVGDDRMQGEAYAVLPCSG
jgi:hypothetical protein